MGTLPTLFMGAAFTLELVLVLIAGSDLATGNMMLVPLSACWAISPGLFVATSYWYLFLEDQPGKITAAEEPAERA